MPRFFDLSTSGKEAVAAAAQAVRQGDLVIFPTETVYGLFFTKASEEKAFAIKGRAANKPCAVHVGSENAWRSLTGKLTPFQEEFIANHLPGPYTVLLPDKVGGVIGVRYPDLEICQAFLTAVGETVFGTSANKSGEKSPALIEETRALWPEVAVVADGGKLSGVASEVVDLTGKEVRILRNRK